MNSDSAPGSGTGAVEKVILSNSRKLGPTGAVKLSVADLLAKDEMSPAYTE
jgi:hypothetical protein